MPTSRTGANDYGQLGDGATADRLTPVAVSGLTGVVAISAGAEYSCALLGDGTARCWGRNLFGQLGDGTTMDRLTPVAVSGPDRGGGDLLGRRPHLRPLPKPHRPVLGD